MRAKCRNNTKMCRANIIRRLSNLKIPIDEFHNNFLQKRSRRRIGKIFYF